MEEAVNRADRPHQSGGSHISPIHLEAAGHDVSTGDN
jgi:hypothetical protein